MRGIKHTFCNITVCMMYGCNGAVMSQAYARKECSQSCGCIKVCVAVQNTVTTVGTGFSPMHLAAFGCIAQEDALRSIESEV